MCSLRLFPWNVSIRLAALNVVLFDSILGFVCRLCGIFHRLFEYNMCFEALSMKCKKHRNVGFAGFNVVLFLTAYVVLFDSILGFVCRLCGIFHRLFEYNMCFEALSMKCKKHRNVDFGAGVNVVLFLTAYGAFFVDSAAFSMDFLNTPCNLRLFRWKGGFFRFNVVPETCISRLFLSMERWALCHRLFEDNI